MTATLRIVDGGLLTTVQDVGRPGLAELGIGPSGACDRGAHLLANRLVGNEPAAATLEVTLGGLAFEPTADITVALTGARCPGLPYAAPFRVRAGQLIRLAPPVSGLRTYVGVRGGVDVAPVLGSRATDTLAHLGPPVVTAGGELPIGRPPDVHPNVDSAPVGEPAAGLVRVRVLPGPRADWFTPSSVAVLVSEPYEVSSESNRVGIRLRGPTIERARDDELPSEGMLLGAVQVPPSGMPVLFLADRPVTGGYPVIAYVDDADLDLCAQLRPGQRIQLSVAAD